MILQELIDAKDWTALLGLLQEKTVETRPFFDEYNGSRDIRDEQVGRRPDKVTKNGPVAVNRIPIQFQKKIVRTAASFLFGEPVRLVHDTDEDGQDENFQMFIDKWEELRLDSKLLELCELVKSETSGAILLRAVADGVIGEEDNQKDVKLKATVLGNKQGLLLPAFNDFGDMVAFAYEFDTTNAEGEEVTRAYLYTQLNVVLLEKDGTDYIEIEPPKPHFFNRIPIVYMSQDSPDWWDVKELIDRYEINYSKFADTNDYFASPSYKATGTIDSMPSVDDTGKVYQLDIIETDKGQIVTSNLEVISWDRAPESLKLEFELNKGLIHSITDTPDLSFDNVKGLGNISGVSLKLMFLSAVIKSKFSQGIFKTGVERLINVLRAGMVYATLDLQANFFEEKITVEFQSILPNNEQELVQMLTTAAMDKPIISQKTAVSRNPFVEDAVKEMENLAEEAANDNQLGESLNL